MALKDHEITATASASSFPGNFNADENGKFLAELSPKSYAHTRPRITVEVLSNKTTSLILNFTYIIFFLCLAYDINREILSFQNDDRIFTPTVLTSVGSNQSTDYSINITNTNIHNVLSIECAVWQQNFSSVLDSLPESFTCGQTIPLTYDFDIFACYRSDGCGDSYAVSAEVSSSKWLKVYSVSQIKYQVDVCAAERSGSINITLLDSAFQPQESGAYNGIIKSYRYLFRVYNNPNLVMIPTTSEVAESITYSFRIQCLDSYIGELFNSNAQGLFLVALFISCASTAIYFWIMFRHKRDWWNWLPEQRWAGMNLIFVLMYQNPLFFVLTVVQGFNPFTDNGGAISYAAILTSFIGILGFQLTWLVFADPIRYRRKTFFEFYWRKLADIFFQLAPFVVALTLLCPTVLPNPPRSATLLVQQWPVGDQIAFVVSAIIFFFARWYWVFHWLFCVYNTNKRLAKMTYMRTRYIQLSFSFFMLQAFWFTLFYFATFFVATVVVFKYLSRNSHNDLQIASALFATGLIQGDIAGFRIFVALYSISLAFLNMPVEIFENQSKIGSNLASTYVITELERKSAVTARVKAIRRLNAMQQSLLDTVSSNTAYVFSVELCILLCNSCLEIYFTMPEEIARQSEYRLPRTADGSVFLSEKSADVDGKISVKDMTGSSQDIENSVAMLSYLENARANEAYSKRNIVSNPEDTTDSPAADKPSDNENERYWEYERLGMSYITRFYDKKTDTLALLYREVATRRLILVFRGTASVANAKTDLKILQIPVDFLSLHPRVPLPACMTSPSGENDAEYHEGHPTNLPANDVNRMASIRESDENDSEDATQQAENNADEREEKEGKEEEEEKDVEAPQSLLSRVSMSIRAATGGVGSRVAATDHDGNDDDDNDSIGLDSVDDVPAPTVTRALSMQNIGHGIAYVKDKVVDVATSTAGVVTYVARDTLWNRTKKSVVACFDNEERQYSIPRVHSGFWEAYLTVREEIHSVLREQLVSEPADLLVTGHSLGGALASVCALDVSIHTVTPINKYLKKKAKQSRLTHIRKNRLLAVST